MLFKNIIVIYILDRVNAYKYFNFIVHMLAEPAHYRHDLGGGEYLDAYSIDPNVSNADVKEFVVSKETGGTDIERYARDIRMIEHPQGHRLWTLGELNFGVVDGKYQVPDELKAYREAIEINEDVKENFNGPKSIIVGKPGTDMTFIEGGFYDWRGTQVAEKPGDLYEELMERSVNDLVGETRFKHARGDEERFYARYDARLIDRMKAGTLEKFLESKGCSEETIRRLKGKKIGQVLEDSEFSRAFDIESGQINELRESYSEGITLGEVMANANLTDDDRARYFGFAHFIFPENGEKLLLVHRAKDMIIAPDCMSSVGSTPDFSKDFFEPGFDFVGFYRDHIAQEMDEELKMKKGEFDIGGFYFSHMVKTGILNPAFEITTPLSTKELARRVYGDEEALSEHPVIYGTTVNGLSRILERFPVFGDISVILNRMCQDRTA